MKSQILNDTLPPGPPQPVARPQSPCVRNVHVFYDSSGVGWEAGSHMFTALFIPIAGIMILTLLIFTFRHPFQPFTDTNVLSPLILFAKAPIGLDENELIDMADLPISQTLRFRRTQPSGSEWAGGYVLDNPSLPSKHEALFTKRCRRFYLRVLRVASTWLEMTRLADLFKYTGQYLQKLYQWLLKSTLSLALSRLVGRAPLTTTPNEV